MFNSRVSHKQSNLRSMHRLQSSSGVVKRQAMSPALVKLKTWIVEGLYSVGQLIFFFVSRQCVYNQVGGRGEGLQRD